MYARHQRMYRLQLKKTAEIPFRVFLLVSIFDEEKYNSVLLRGIK